MNLNLSDDYASAFVELVDIVSDKHGKAHIAEHTHAVDTAGPNGCVESFEFHGDGRGDDYDAHVIAKLLPLRLKLRFRMPDGAVGLQADSTNRLFHGIPLR